MLTYRANDLMHLAYTDSDFQSDTDARKSTSGYVLLYREGLFHGEVLNKIALLTLP